MGVTEGFFTLAYATAIPEYPEGGIVAHYEPPAPEGLRFDTTIHNGRIDGLSRLLTMEGKFNFDKRTATIHTVPVGVQEETYVLVPGRRKCLYFLMDLFEERTGYKFAPIPEMFDDFDDMRSTLEYVMPDLHSAAGNVRSLGWYNLQVDSTKRGIVNSRDGVIDARETGDIPLMMQNVSALGHNMCTFETCFPRTPGYRREVHEALVDPDRSVLPSVLSRF